VGKGILGTVLLGFIAVCVWISFAPRGSGERGILDLEQQLGRLAGEQANALRDTGSIHVIGVSDAVAGRVDNAANRFVRGLKDGAGRRVKEHLLNASLDYEGTGEIVSAKEMVSVIQSLPEGEVLVSPIGLPRDLTALQAALSERNIGLVVATMFDVPPADQRPADFPDVLIVPGEGDELFAVTRP